AATYVQEVGRLAAGQLDNVHGTHGQACTVNHAADVAFQRNVVELPLGRFRFPGVFLGGIVHLVDFLLAVQRVAIYAYFGVETVQVTGRGDYQRVDFDQRQVALFKQFGQAQENLGELTDLLAFQAQLERQLATLVRLSADQRNNFGFQDLFRSFFSNLLDFHATFSRGHENDTTGTTVYHCAQVQLLVDVGEGFNQNLADRLAVFVGLVGNQVLTQPLFGEFTDLFFALDQLYTAGLAATTSVNLGFDYPAVAADFVCRCYGFLGSIAGNAFGYGQAVLSEQLLALIFVQIHS